ncbi:unnamed protein product, partial [Prorocentrum cordatum]
MASHAVIWREVWWLLEERGGELTERVLKVQAHPRVLDFRLGSTSKRQNAGNVIADRFAKWAAQASRTPEAQRDAIANRAKILKAWCRWISKVGEGDDTFHPSQ